jgi:large subunit ribosomal protein L17
MAVIELVREKTVTSEANRARRAAAKAEAPVESVEEVKAEDEAIADAQTAEAEAPEAEADE